MGLSGVEIPMFDPSALPVDSIRNAFEANGLECTVCAILPKSINPISPDAGVRRRAIEHLTRCVEAARAMGAKLLGGPLFAPIGYLPRHRPRPAELSWAATAFQALSSVLDENDMQLSLEPVNRSETFFLRTAAEAKQLCELIGNPRIGVTIDTFHANIEEKDPIAAIRTCADYMVHVHISENDRSTPGAGNLPWAETFDTLKETGYQGWITVELYPYIDDPDEAGLEAKQYLERTLRKIQTV